MARALSHAGAVVVEASRSEQVPVARLALFASGDFGFNLFWQSATYYLLFFYTDVLGIEIRTAATIFLLASLWDGLASFAIGVLIDARSSGRTHRRLMTWGAVPLGLSFCFVYLQPSAGLSVAAWMLAGQLLFRTAYAAVNIPYLALTARVSTDSRDRALVAGLRMLAGTAAAVAVTAGTIPIGRALMNAKGEAAAFLAAAILFAGIGAALIALVGWTFRDRAPVAAVAHRIPIATALAHLARNRAFTTLAAAMMAMVVATTVLGKSVLYFYKYVLADQTAGQLALASMATVSALAVPVWMVVARRIGARAQWFWAAGACAAGAGSFALVDFASIDATRLFLAGMQAATMGLHLAFWALLPDTVEWGQQRSGHRVEATAFGLATLLQRVAIGIATLLLGFGLNEAGYRANVLPSAAAAGNMRLVIALLPLGFFALSALIMAWCPLRQGAHAAAVRALEGERASGS